MPINYHFQFTSPSVATDGLFRYNVARVYIYGGNLLGISSLMSDPQAFFLELLYILPAILFALTFHEWGHAFAAHKLGDNTARNLGRMTLNPFAHIDPMGFLMMVLFRFGWAKPVPVNSRNFKNYRRDDVIVSVAGITMNFLLAIAGFIGIYVFALIEGTNIVIANMLFYFVSINLSLMVFNLIPLHPLDGSHIIESVFIKLTGPKPFIFLARYGSYILLALLLTGLLSDFLGFVIGPIFDGLMTVFDSIFGIHGLGYVFHIMAGGI